MSNNIKTWQGSVLQQLAAESYLDKWTTLSRDEKIIRLSLGSNNFTNPDNVSSAPILSGATRMTAIQADDFLNRYEIVSHLPNTASGFSGTLVREITTGVYTLAFRSTEYFNASQGGDWERDGISGADGEILQKGFAFGQIASMESYYDHLKAGQSYNEQSGQWESDATLADFKGKFGSGGSGGLLNVSGYSLSGSLADVFTELHSEVAHAYTINPTGRGNIGNGNLRAMVDEVRRRLDTAGINVTDPSIENIYRPDPTFPDFPTPYRIIIAGLALEYSTGYSIVGDDSLENAKITQLYGHGANNDIQLASNTGLHVPATKLFIEDQPDVQGFGPFSRFDNLLDLDSEYGTTHSITLLVDSLAVMSILEKMNLDMSNTAGLQTAYDILAAGTNERATGFIGWNGVAESTSLESIVSGLHQLVTGTEVTLIADPGVKGFSNISNRNALYEALDVVDQTIAGTGTLHLESLVGKTANDLILTASDPDPTNALAIAYRYALKALDPFVVTGVDYQTLHNANHELDMYDPTSGTGVLTARWIEDRSAFLAAQNATFTADREAIGWNEDREYIDFASNTHFFTSTFSDDEGLPIPTLAARQVVFGGDDSGPLHGGGKDDRIYGGAGGDRLTGLGGMDYLEGDQGIDILDGGAGDDTLIGGKDNDDLNGGQGWDTYVWNTGDGFDTITGEVREGSNGEKLGTIKFLQQLIVGTKVQVNADDPRLFSDPEIPGLFFSFTGATGASGMLTITKTSEDGGLQILDFRSGDFGIVIPAPTVPTMTEESGTESSDNTASSQPGHQTTLAADAPNEKLFGQGGNDRIVVARPGAQAFGGPGNDFITDGGDDQKLFGEVGDDILIASGGNDELYGGSDDDALQGGDDDDYLDGDEGNDFLDGGAGSDVISGGAGSDFILGGGSAVASIVEGENDSPAARHFGVLIEGDATGFQNMSGVFAIEGDGQNSIDAGEGNDVVIGGDSIDYIDGGANDDMLTGLAGTDYIVGGEGNDRIWGDATEGAIRFGSFSLFTLPQYQSADYIDGGSGDDVLAGDGGDDEILGGSGDDVLIGDADDLDETWHGADYMDGGDGNDRMYGYGKDDTLFGGIGDDWMEGDAGTVPYDQQGKDYLDGEDGNDHAQGDGGSDTLFGGVGNDQLFGDSDDTPLANQGDDYLDGEEGDDYLRGYAGRDRLYGGSGIDQLLGDAGADYLNGEAGDDTLSGGDGEDNLFGGEGDDDLQGDGENDRLDGGSGNDLLAGGEGQDVLLGSNGDDQLAGDAGNDTLNGGDGADRLFGDSGDDDLTGGGGNDQIVGGEGNDHLTGSDGADYLEGGPGDDTYSIDALDTVVDLEGNNSILFMDQTRLDDIIVRRENSGGNQYFVYSVGAHQVLITGAAGPAPSSVSFSDATTLSGNELLGARLKEGRSLAGGDADDVLHGYAGNDVLLGNAGDDALFGYKGADDLIGGTGNDWLQGGEGNDLLQGQAGEDIYIFGRSDGSDTVIDNENAPGNANVIRFKADIGPADLMVRRNDNLATSVEGVYVGSLNLILRDSTEQQIAQNPYPNGVYFPLEVYADQLMVWGWFGDTANRQIRVEFSDGTVWGETEIRAMLFSATQGKDYLVGTISSDILDGLDGDDQLWGDSGDDTICGSGGSDFIRGGPGNDFLSGGTGNDVLIGGMGDDVYWFDVGFGQDYVNDFNELDDGETNDVIRFASGIKPQDVTLVRDPDTYITLNVNDTADRIYLPPEFIGEQGRIEWVQFADGTVWDETVFLQFVFPENDNLSGTAFDDSIDGRGGNDTLLGLGGDDTLTGGWGDDVLNGGADDDTLYGFTGDDVLDGGAGNDFLFGGTDDSSGTGNDTYVFARGYDVDTVSDFYGAGVNLDVVLFGADIHPDDVTVARSLVDTDDLVLDINGTADSLIIRNWFVSDAYKVEQVRFSDGITWDIPQLDAMAIPPNRAPTLAYAIRDQSVTEDAQFIFQIPANAFADIDFGDTLTYGAALYDGSALPNWLTFNAGTRTFIGTPVNNNVGTISIVVTATDEASASSSDVFEIAVANINDAPTVANSIDDQVAIEDAAFSFQIPENAFADVDVGDALGYGATLANGLALPSWLSFNAGARTFSGTPVNANVGTISTRVTATDGSGAAVSQIFDITVANTNDAPALANEIVDQSATEDASFRFQIPENVFADVDQSEVLVYAATLLNGSALPSWLTFNSSTRTFSGSPLNADVGTTSVKVMATDGSSASTMDVFDVTVTNTNDAPTVSYEIADQAAIEDAVFSFQVPTNTFADVDVGDALVYGATLAGGAILPSWLTFNASTRTFSATPLNANVGAINVMVTGTDGAGATVSDDFMLVVANSNDDPVVISPILDQMVFAGSAFGLTVDASAFSDMDPGDLLSYSATLANAGPLPSWLTFEPMTRRFAGIPMVVDVGLLQVRVNATDTAGADVFDVFSLTVAAATGKTVIGTNGSDVLSGTTFSDVIDGRAGADSMAGRGGDDTYYVDNAGDLVTELAGQGNDTIFTSVRYGLSDNVENITLVGVGNIRATGNALDNVLVGNSGINTLDGNAGNDTLDGKGGADLMAGGTGNDIYYIDNPSDRVTEFAGRGVDTVKSTISYTLGPNVENLILIGSAAIGGTGNIFSNLLVGNSAANALAGKSGGDILQGLGGNDALSATGGHSLFDGGAGADSFAGAAGNEMFIGGRGNDSIETGTGADIIVFNEGDGQDSVNASSGSDNVLSLGGGIRYADLKFAKSGSNLILRTGGTDQITFRNWYAGTGRHSIAKLQIFTEGMVGYSEGSPNSLLNDKVEQFNFVALARAFDAAGQVSGWALTNALLSAHLSGSDVAAIGGDLAYQYGKNSTLNGIGLASAQDVINSQQFGSAAQALRTLAELQQGQVRLS